MKSYYCILFIIVASLFSQEQIFKLKDGTKIVGTIQEKTDTTLNVLTQFGIITIDKNDILKTQHQVKLNTGETFIGEIINETPDTIILKTKMGKLTLPNSNILNIEEILYPSEQNIAEKNSFIKESEFALGEEQLTDLFFDATGYTLKKGTFYLSGLSFGFGVSDKFELTTKWFSYFWGDLNFRPKYKLFEKGNWEKQQSLSVGAHLHIQDAPGNRHEWVSGQHDLFKYTGTEVDDDKCQQTWGDCFQQTAPRDTITKYWGGYFPIGTEIELYDPKEEPGYYPDSLEVYYNQDQKNHIEYTYVNNEGDKIPTIEFFGVYTFSKARNNSRTSGRMSHTIGGSTIFYPSGNNNEISMIYRIYYGIDLDINKKMKMIGEIFYDPSFIDPWDRGDGSLFGAYYTNTELQDQPVQKEEYFPIHLDFGFMYAFNESFRCGIHFQKPVIAFYWKF